MHLDSKINDWLLNLQSNSSIILTWSYSRNSLIPTPLNIFTPDRKYAVKHVFVCLESLC